MCDSAVISNGLKAQSVRGIFSNRRLLWTTTFRSMRPNFVRRALIALEINLRPRGKCGIWRIRFSQRIKYYNKQLLHLIPKIRLVIPLNIFRNCEMIITSEINAAMCFYSYTPLQSMTIEYTTSEQALSLPRRRNGPSHLEELP